MVEGAALFCLQPLQGATKLRVWFSPMYAVRETDSSDQNAQETDSKARSISDPSQLEAHLSGPDRVRKTPREVT